jgi:[ribosomal protein S5]-alanine N-acetyltransferase
VAATSRMDLMPSTPSTVSPSVTPASVPRDWRAGLPVLVGAEAVLRELRASDAPALLTAFGSPEVTRLISPPPPTIDGFEKFVAWTQSQREAGQSFALGITLKGSDTVIGLFQVRALQPGFDIAEWGFALSAEQWGTGLFPEAAELVLDFVFDVIGVHRLEARAALKNGRGNGALQKLGAVQEGVLQRSFLRNGIYLDQALWTILADDRRGAGAFAVGQLVH